jgi:parallel beta-helix repeat protein
VVTTSKNGTTWTTPKPIDQPKLPGHQLFPSLTYNTGKLLIVYNDYRADASGVFERFIVDLMDATHPMRHTVDVRAAVANPADAPVFTDYSLLNPSSQVSRYPFIVTGTGASDAKSLQLQYNPPNLPMFELGHKPFFGDYHDVAGAPRFVPTGNGTWSYNSAPSTAPVFHAVWTDNRDVVGPPDGKWENYVPPGVGGPSLFDPAKTVPACVSTLGDQDRTQMRNQNIYTSRLVSGLFVAVPSNSRPLSPDFQRAFVIFVQNATDAARQFSLQILNQPAGGEASFQQFSTALTQDVTIGAYSSISQAVFVQSSSPTASVDVQVTELGPCSSTNTCLQSAVRINPDSSNPPPADASLLAREIYNPAVYNPAVYNPAVYNPAVFNPAVFNPAVFNLDLSNPAVLNYGVINYGVNNPAVFNPAVLNPAVFNIDAFNNAVMNQAFFNPAVFNPAVLNPAVLNPAVFNPAVFNPAVLNPAVLNPAVFNPAVFNPAVLNPAVFNPAVFNTALSDGSVTEANFQVENAGNATAAYSFNLNLANQQPGLTYQLMIYRLYFVPVANGCELTEAAQQELLVNDLAPNLNAKLFDPNGGDSFFLNPGDVAIATLRVIPDPSAEPPGDPSKFNIEDLSVSVVSDAVNSDDAANGDTQPPFAPILPPAVIPLVIDSTPLPSGVVGSAYATTLAATGGAVPRVWSAFGALPPGLTLSPAGVLAGTPTTAGSFTFTIRVTDAMQLAERTVTVSVASAPAPTVLTFTVQPSDATAGQPMVPQVVVEGTPALLPGVSVNIALGTIACSAATLFGSTTVVTNAAGVAIFPALVVEKGGWGYTLKASATANPSINVTSSAFNVEGFCDTGSMVKGRAQFSATLLPNTKVLVAGGLTADPYPITETAELFDPSGNSSLGSFAPTGSMSSARRGPRSTLLPDGEVLISGGDTPGGTYSSAELFDPAGGGGLGGFTATGSMTTARRSHASTLLSEGRVLITGGRNNMYGFLSSAELFDPAGGGGLGSFTATGSMTIARTEHTATPLVDGRVLVSGGFTPYGVTTSAEIYDPTTGTISLTGSMGTGRRDHAATLLSDGTVLISGGIDSDGVPLNITERFDPAGNEGEGTFTPSGTMGLARAYHTATLLPDGKVLISGGANSAGLPENSAEIFDPAGNDGEGTFTPAGSMGAGRAYHTATLLPDGKVLIAAGYGTGNMILSSAELFFPLPPTIFLVTNTSDSGAGSLRKAILDANAHPGLDAIHFNIPGLGAHTISPATALPIITDPVLLDATTQPGYAGTPVIRLDGASAGAAINGLEIQANNSLVQGFMVTGFSNVGAQLTNASATRLANNYVGTDGTAAFGNGRLGSPWPYGGGIFVSGGSGNVLDGNLVSGNIGNGIELGLGTIGAAVRNNRVGTNAAGDAAIGNGAWGILVYGTATAGNIIRSNLSSGNVNQGVYLHSGAHHNTVAGNLIGSNSAGIAAVPNNGGGVALSDGAHDNTIGGTAPGDANIIVGNAYQGIYLTHATTTGNLIYGNCIGTNELMATNLGNAFEGILIQGAANTQIGGPSPGEGNVIAFNQTGVLDRGSGNQTVGNVISGNSQDGVRLWDATGASIKANRIGTDADGAVAMRNGGAGIMLLGSTSGNTVGGALVADGNLISGNGANGITLDSLAGAVTGTVIAGNMIGTNALGTGALGNTGDGIGIYNGATGTTVIDNVIAASTKNGIRLNNVSGNTIRHNWIGTNAALASGLGNGNQGISVAASTGTIIGGTNAGDGNVVAYNAEGGIGLESAATNTQILGNILSGNTGPGIGVFDSQNTTIAGNKIGTDASGTSAFGNTSYGILVASDSSGNTIGGPNPADQNVISANGPAGIYIAGPAHDNTVEGNRIGTDVTGNAALPNSGGGIAVIGGANNTLRANLVLGNTLYDGIDLGYGATGNLVENNLTGTNAGGTATLGNQNNGVWIYVATSGTNTIRGNVISGCQNSGVIISDGAHDNVVVGNKIGTNAAGSVALGNGGDGIVIGTGATGNTILDNVLAANDAGMLLSSVTHNTIQHNWVGTNAALAPGLGNTSHGIWIVASSDNLVGGSAGGYGNVVANNGGAGVFVYSGTGDAVLSNSIFANGGLGITLGSGANDNLAAPFITSAEDNGSNTTVTGTVNVGVVGATVHIQFFVDDSCDPSGYGEGQTLLGTSTVVTNTEGLGQFNVTTFPTGLLGKVITATTNTLLGPGGNTSGFSACRTVVGP